MTSEDRRLINALIEYRCMINEPGPRWPEMEFDKNSYSGWAVDEIMLMIMAHPDWTVMKCVETFKAKMLEFACYSSNFSEANFIFEIAYETADDLSDVLGGML